VLREGALTIAWRVWVRAEATWSFTVSDEHPSFYLNYVPACTPLHHRHHPPHTTAQLYHAAALGSISCTVRIITLAANNQKEQHNVG
jgi:hypothetical protein